MRECSFRMNCSFHLTFLGITKDTDLATRVQRPPLLYYIHDYRDLKCITISTTFGLDFWVCRRTNSQVLLCVYDVDNAQRKRLRNKAPHPVSPNPFTIGGPDAVLYTIFIKKENSAYCRLMQRFSFVCGIEI